MIDNIDLIPAEQMHNEDASTTLINHVHDAMHATLHNYKLKKLSDDNEVLDFPRLATMMGSPHVSEICSQKKSRNCR